MSRMVRAALLQATWTGDKESMIQKHEDYARKAAAQGAKVMCFQELFYGPYFAQVQDAQFYAYTELIPDGPTTKRMQALARETGHGPDRADVRAGRAHDRHLLQHRRRHRLRRHVPRQVPQDPHPPRQGLLGEVLLPARQPRLPGLRDRGRQGRRLHLLRPPLPGGRASARASTAPSSSSSRRPPAAACPSTSGGSSRSATPWPTATSSGTINRVGIEPLGDDDFYGQSYFVDPRGQFVGAVGDAHDEELIVRDLDMDMVQEVRQTWQFYRDRRPEMYADLVHP